MKGDAVLHVECSEVYSLAVVVISPEVFLGPEPLWHCDHTAQQRASQ